MIQPQTVVIPWSANPVFDGAVGEAWELTLKADVAAATFLNQLPGVLYTVSIGQDATGGHAFPWPGNVFGAQAVHAAASVRTVQVFVCRGDGRLYPVTAGEINGS